MAEVIGFVTWLELWQWRRVRLLFKTSLEPLHMNDGFSVEVKTKKANIFPHL